LMQCRLPPEMRWGRFKLTQPIIFSLYYITFSRGHKKVISNILIREPQRRQTSYFPHTYARITLNVSIVLGPRVLIFWAVTTASWANSCHVYYLKSLPPRCSPMSLKLLLLSVAAEMMGLLPRFAADDALRKTGLWNQNTQSYNKKIS